MVCSIFRGNFTTTNREPGTPGYALTKLYRTCLNWNLTSRFWFCKLTPSGCEQIDKTVDRSGLESRHVGREGQDLVHLPGRELAPDGRLELLQQHRDTLPPAFAVADREIDRDPVGRRPVLEEDLHRVADVALVRIEIVLRELRVLAYFHLR